MSARVARRRHATHAADDGEMGPTAVSLRDELQRQRLRRLRGAVLERQHQPVTVARQVSVRVAKRVQIRAATQGLPGLGAVLLAGVVHEHDGQIERPLQLPQEAQEPGDVRRAVLIQTMQSHERIEDQHMRAQLAQDVAQALLIDVEVEAQHRRGDDMEVEGGDVEGAVAAERLDASADGGERVLGEIHEGGAGVVHGEAAQAGRARGDADGQLEAEPGLATLGRPAHDPDGGPGPEVLHEPAGALRRGPDLGGAEDLQWWRGHGQSAFRASAT
jgi:hypothetical protein